MLKRRPAITVNFSGIDYRVLTAVRRSLAIAAVLLALLAGWMVLQILASREQGASVARQISELSASQAKLRPDIEEHQRIMRDLNAMSGLLEARRFSWTRLLTSIEEAFPAGIALARVEYKAKEHSTVLEGTAQSPEALSSLMIGLQRSAAFRSPLLKHQSMDKGNLTFDVTVQYQPPVAAGPAAQPARRSGN